VKGSIDKDEKGVRVRGLEISNLEDAGRKSVKRMEISLRETADSRNSLQNIRSLVTEYPGDCQLYLRITSSKSHTLIATGISIKPDTALVNRLETMIGKGAITVS
jgi:hypothetical protein